MHHALVQQRVHDIAPAGDHGERKAGGDRLGVDREVGRHARTAPARRAGDAKAGDDLVADEERPLGAAEIAHAGKVAVVGHDGAAIHHHRLHDDGGDLAGMAVEGGLERGEIVPAGDHDVIEHAFGHARRTRDRDRQFGRSRLVQRRPRADIGLVAPAVIMALELQDLGRGR